MRRFAILFALIWCVPAQADNPSSRFKSITLDTPLTASQLAPGAAAGNLGFTPQKVKNVLDAGADPSGVNSSSAAITASMLGSSVVIPAGSFLLSTDVIPVASSGKRVVIDPSATFSTSKLRVDNLIPFQITPSGTIDLISKSYGSEYIGYFNIFQSASYARAAVAGPAVVATFGEGDAAANGAQVWGGNFVGIASAAGGIALAAEFDVGVLNPTGVGYGVVIVSSGSSPAQNAIQIQANGNAPFKDGVVFNSSNFDAVSGSLVKMPNGRAAYGLNFSGTFSSAEILTPQFVVPATPANLNSQVRISGSSNGNPSVYVTGGGSTPATDANLTLQALGTGGVVVNGKLAANAVIARGAAPMASGVCAINTQVGGNAAGSFKATAACSSSSLTFTFAYAAPNGWACSVNNLTTPANAIRQVATMPTTATFSATMTAGDLAVFQCTGF